MGLKAFFGSFASKRQRQSSLSMCIGLTLIMQASYSTGAESNPVLDLPKGSEVAVARLLELRPEIPIISVYPVSVDGMFGIDLPGGTTLFAVSYTHLTLPTTPYV